MCVARPPPAAWERARKRCSHAAAAGACLLPAAAVSHCMCTGRDDPSRNPFHSSICTMPRQVLGAVGSARKRVLLLWQAVELSKFLGFPNTRTLDVAR